MNYESVNPEMVGSRGGVSPPDIPMIYDVPKPYESVRCEMVGRSVRRGGVSPTDIP